VDKLGTQVEGKGLKVGTRAPKVKLQNIAGETVALQELYSKGPVLVVFYRGAWCPYCNYQVHALTEAYPEFQSIGVTPVLISVDKPDTAATTEAAYKVPFPLLSDSALEAHRAFNVVHQVDGEELQKLQGYGIDLEKYSGQTHHSIAVPSAFIVVKGVVRWVHADPDYATRPTAAQLLEVSRKTLKK